VNETSLDALEGDCETLTADIAALSNPSRREFLTVQVRAMRTMLRLLRDEDLSYGDEVHGLHDIDPEHVPEARFEATIGRLEDLLPGSGTVAQRWRALRARFEVAPERLSGLVSVINSELRSRTRRLLELPDRERIEFKLVQNKPWSGYNWYLGNAQSRVEINTDLPTHLHTLPDLVAHEGYPGHHTERVFKDALDRNWSRRAQPAIAERSRGGAGRGHRHERARVDHRTGRNARMDCGACVEHRFAVEFKYILVLDVRHVKILDRKNAVLDNFNLLSIKLMI
jgi:hypothetical protein